MRSTKILELSRFGRVLLPILMVYCMDGYAQKTKAINLLEFKYGFHLPMGDMKDRFGSTSAFGLNIESVQAESKLFFGIEGMYFFGNAVKEDVLASLRSSDGSIIGIDGLPGDINLKERGYYIGVNAGKIFSTTSHKNNLTGFRAQIGGGLLQHKIRVQDNARSVPALNDEYLQGYDRLSNGPAIHLGLGYHYQSPYNNFQFHIMTDLYGAQTVSRRDLDYATGQYDDQKRIDLLGGVSIAYIVSISRASRPDNIYY